MKQFCLCNATTCLRCIVWVVRRCRRYTCSIRWDRCHNALHTSLTEVNSQTFCRTAGALLVQSCLTGNAGEQLTKTVILKHPNYSKPSGVVSPRASLVIHSYDTLTNHIEPTAGCKHVESQNWKLASACHGMHWIELTSQLVEVMTSVTGSAVHGLSPTCTHTHSWMHARHTHDKHVHIIGCLS